MITCDIDDNDNNNISLAIHSCVLYYVDCELEKKKEKGEIQLKMPLLASDFVGVDAVVVAGEDAGFGTSTWLGPSVARLT